MDDSEDDIDNYRDAMREEENAIREEFLPKIKFDREMLLCWIKMCDIIEASRAGALADEDDGLLRAMTIRRHARELVPMSDRLIVMLSEGGDLIPSEVVQLGREFKKRVDKLVA